MTSTFEATFFHIVKYLFTEKDYKNTRTGVKKYFQEGGTERELVSALHSFMIRKELFDYETTGKLGKLMRDCDRDFILGVSPQLVIDCFLRETIHLLSTLFAAFVLFQLFGSQDPGQFIVRRDHGLLFLGFEIMFLRYEGINGFLIDRRFAHQRMDVNIQ